jgi:hypothetical protein
MPSRLIGTKTVNPSLGGFAISLFLLNIILDPNNALLHTKQIALLVALCLNYKKLKVSQYSMSILVVFYLAFFLSLTLMLLRNITFDKDFIGMYSTTFLTLVIFCFDADKISVNQGFNVSCFIIAWITIILSFIILLMPATSIVILKSEVLNKVFMFAEQKELLFWNVTSVFHRAVPLLIIQLSIKFYQFCNRKNIINVLSVLFYFIALVFTGTRASSFAAILVVGLIYLYYIYFIKKRTLMTVGFVLLFLSFFLIGTYLLIVMKNSSSIAKDGHVISYIQLFNDNPLYFLLGQGPGSLFYTQGFGRFTTNTELSYIELIRMFGIFFTVLIVCLFCTPFYFFMKNPCFFTYSVCVGYLAYLFIAGTNPLLIGPTGFIAFWICYNYIVSKQYKESFKS